MNVARATETTNEIAEELRMRVQIVYGTMCCFVAHWNKMSSHIKILNM